LANAGRRNFAGGATIEGQKAEHEDEAAKGGKLILDGIKMNWPKKYRHRMAFDFHTFWRLCRPFQHSHFPLRESANPWANDGGRNQRNCSPAQMDHSGAGKVHISGSELAASIYAATK
jgi:hypothetical protein